MDDGKIILNLLFAIGRFCEAVSGSLAAFGQKFTTAGLGM
jgi:hypothetical protein